MVAKVEADADKFYNSSSSAAGTRVCKAMQDLKVFAGDIRKDLKRKEQQIN
ncbi:histone H1 [Pedobacter sp. UYP1]|uniref:histone H1 n=1 Tax=Pedobacter sp. UYP1 TaxID=1756396 RepID=UPI00339888D5